MNSSLLTAGDSGALPGSHTTPQLIHETLDIGRLVRTQRRSQGLRIDDAAALVRVSVDLFSRLENGKGAIRLDKLLTVLDGMGLCLVVGPKSHPVMRKMLQPRPTGTSPAGAGREAGE